MVRERRVKKSKSKDVEEPVVTVPDTLAVPAEPKINRYFKREKSPFEVGDKKELQVASSHAIIDKACVMDISGGAAGVAGKMDEYINLLFTDYCSLDKASCADISEVKIVIIEEEETEPVVIVPERSIEEQDASLKAEKANAERKAEEARIQAETEEQERIAREETEKIAKEEAEKAAAEEAEKKRLEEEEKARIAAEKEKERLKAEAEAKQKAEAEEKARIAAEEEERRIAEEEKARKEAEIANYDSDRDLIPPKEEPGIDWEAVEEEEPAIPAVLQELLLERSVAAETETESESEMTEKDRDLEWQRQRQMMRPPLVITHLKSRAVATCTTAKLTCNVTGPGILVRWLKNGAPIEINPNKYKFFNREGLLSLEISNVDKSDNAEYTCFVKNKNGETSTVASLTVYDNLDLDRPIPPTFITIKAQKSLDEEKPVEEEKVELDKWGDPIKKSKRKVRPLSLWAQREKLEFTVHLHKMTVIEDKNARFICGVSGGGKLEILWYKNGKKIRFERTPRILDYSKDSTGCIGIECTQPSDAGIYSCTFTDIDKNESLSTSCELIVVPRIHKTKELAQKVPPTFVRKLQYTHKLEENQLIVHCKIFGNPEPTIKWFKDKIPLNMFSIPRYTIYNHPDDLHEHTIASLIVESPSYLDNGDYIIEIENEMGVEKRVLNVQFQTEEEYNNLYFQKYLEHKENLKYHQYQPGETRWEDVVPEVKEFVFWEPEEEKENNKNNKKKRKKKRKILKTIVTPWGDEKQVEVTDEEDSGESIYDSEDEKQEKKSETPEDEGDNGWNVEGEVALSEEEGDANKSESKVDELMDQEQSQIVETSEDKESNTEPQITDENKVSGEVEKDLEHSEEIETENVFNDNKVLEIQQDFEALQLEEDNKTNERKSQEVEELENYISTRKTVQEEHPIILRRPKFYITDFQLRKKFYFVNKLIDVELLKGKTLTMQSLSSSIGPVTCEWRHNGRLIKAPTARKTIEFYPRKNLTILEIENTRVLDSGTYTVTVYNDYTEPLIDSCKVMITVPKPKETADQPPTFTRLLTDKYIERTDELILDCHVRGNPKPTIQWFKNNLEILPDRNERYRVVYDDEGTCTLTISNPIKHADRGRYEVKAKNCMGEDACYLRVWFRGKDDGDDKAEKAEYRRTQKMFKSRHVKPKDEDEWQQELYHSKRLDKQKEYDHRYKLSWLTHPYPQTLAQGSTLKFTAFVDGKYPQFDWYYNDIPLIHGRKYRQIVTKNGKGSLIINNVQPSDSGLYKLIVKNYANSIESEAKVTVYAYEHKNFEPPLFTNTLSDSYDTVTNQLVIECNINPSLDFKKHRFKWYKDDSEIRTSFIPSEGMLTTYEQNFDDNTGKLMLIITYPMNIDCGLYRCCILDNNLKKVDEISHLVYKIFNPPPHLPAESYKFSDKKNSLIFEQILNDVSTEEGRQSIRLNCKLPQLNSRLDIKWYRNNEEILIEQKREKYRFTKAYNRLCLEILNLTIDDAGTYECKVKTSNADTSTKCNVYVNKNESKTYSGNQQKEWNNFTSESDNNIVESTNKILLDRTSVDTNTFIRGSSSGFCESNSSAQRPIFATPLSDRTITENTSFVKFTCSVLSTDCDISWEKNGIPIRPSSKYRQTFSDGLAILEISNLDDDDEAKYSCIASNRFGECVTSAKLKVFSGFKPSVNTPPVVTRQMKESYNLHNDVLTLECRVRGTPKPHVQWMKDGDYIIPGDKYEQCELSDGTCKLIIATPDPEEDSGTYTCEAECNGCSDSISHNVQYEGSVENQFNRMHRYYHRDPLKPYFKTGLTDCNISSGGTIALFIETAPNCEAEWFRDRWTIDHKPPKRYIFNDGNGFFACVINHATMDESAKYICKVTNSYGTSQSSSYVDIINPNSVGKGQKPPTFLTRPQTEIKIRAGDPFSMSFRVQGEPKPRIQWFKGAREITNAGRTIKEVFNDYVRFSIKESKESDCGIYFIVARNKHGVDRAFCQVTVRERQGVTDDNNLSPNIEITDALYLKITLSFSNNHVSLSWMKPLCHDAAPVISYRVDAWLVGKEGDASWKEIGTSPIASFDVFNLKHGCEYHFRVTPRNRYGYGPSTQTTYPIMFGDVVKLPEFTKILPGQLKALINNDITLECVAMGSPRPTIIWYKDGIRIDGNEKRVISIMGPLCRLTIHNISESDSGRYTCEASNKEGRVSTFARLQSVSDPKLFEADTKLKKNIETDIENLDEMLPQFTMRLRDRRVQCTYPVRLTCQALGVPSPVVTWYKDGVKIEEDERIAFLQEDQFSTLEISRTYLEDCGQYTASAQNELGSVSCHCNLIVDKGIRAYIAPEFLKTLDLAYTCNEDGEIFLQAQVEAYPAVGVTWHLNGLRLRPSRRIIASLETDGLITLNISEVTIKDAGVYTCVASNAVGRIESTCRVHVNENVNKKLNIPSIVSPDTPYSKEPMFLTKPRSSEAFEGDTVIIMCEVIGDPKPEVVWLRDFLKPEYYKDAPHFRSVIGNESEYRLEIPQAKIDYTGTYSVIATNCYGQTKAIISLQIYAKDINKGSSMDAGSIIHGNVETLPRVIKHLKDLRCCDGDAVTLECHIQGEPDPNVFWEKDGKIIHDKSVDYRQSFDGRRAKLSISRVFPEDEGQYCLVASNSMGRVKSKACIIVDIPEEKENLLNRTLSRPMTFLSLNSTPHSTPRSTPARSMSPLSLHASTLKASNNISQRQRRYRFAAPKFYSVPHNRVCEEGETVRFQCAISGHPIPWSTWDKDGIIVTPSQRFTIKERDDLRYLEIEEVCYEDAGLYRITLENDYGRIEATARLDIIKTHKTLRRGIRASSAPTRSSRSMSRRIMGYSTKIGGRMALATQKRASSIPSKKMVFLNGYDVTNHERLSISENENEILIEVHDVKSYDEGEYTLMLETDDFVLTTSTFVKVYHENENDIEKVPPTLKQPLTNITSIEGIPLDLTFMIDCNIPFDYLWQRNGETILNCDDFIYIDHGKGVLTLRITDPFIFDSGNYSCTVTTPYGDCTTSCDIEIEEPFDNISHIIPEFVKAPLPTVAFPGNSASFCARVSPVDSIVQWSVSGVDITDDDKDFVIERLESGINLLHLLNVQHHLSGEVKCCATSAIDPRIFSVYHTNLTVLPLPLKQKSDRLETSLTNLENKSSLVHDLTAYITKRPDDLTVLVGDSIQLYVEFVGFPEPKVRWMRAERSIENDSNTIIITRNGQSKLSINNITSDQGGKYSVEIMNEHSQDIASVSVAVEGIPDAPTALSISKGLDRIAVAWSGPPYDGGCMILGFLLEMQQNENKWQEIIEVADSLAYTVKNLDCGVRYKFRVRAKNVHGYSLPSNPTDEIILSPPKEINEMTRMPHVRSGGNFRERFEILEELGKGRFGVVHKVIEKETGVALAAKFIKCIKSLDRKKVQDEIKVMKSLHHPKLLQLSASFETQKEIIMVMEYLTGGELFERVVADDFTLTERDCILFIRQICEGVDYMHGKSIVHLDLKPENVLCYEKMSHEIKIIDFGLAQKLEPNKQVRVLFGTPEFIPPEIINYEPIGLQSDMWSVGVICYVLLSGLSPFMGETDVDTFANITRADYDFADDAFDAVSDEAREFIAALLVHRKEDRLTAKQCLNSSWLSQHNDGMGNTKLSTDKLKKFIIRRKWQKTGNAIRALGRLATLSASRKSSATSPPRPLAAREVKTENNTLIASPLSNISEQDIKIDSSVNLNSSEKMCKSHQTCSERSDSGFSEGPNSSAVNSTSKSNLNLNKCPTITKEKNDKSLKSNTLIVKDSSINDNQNLLSIKHVSRYNLEEKEDLRSEVDKRKQSLLKNNNSKVLHSKHAYDFESLKKSSKVSLLKGKFESKKSISSITGCKIKLTDKKDAPSTKIESNSTTFRRSTLFDLCFYSAIIESYILALQT
ncbi:CLUMA_CG014043, isoform B [Clunio marinus]|uniref:CLUMA_CG014043, isoform B n=1 Tax=Clunio marinus TaxID=568069 RepID=A0A1J1INX1_9DIPT|nr:CLUMA_CG014043, isoform B [Clunio marinus]